MSQHSLAQATTPKIVVYFFLLIIFPAAVPAEPTLPHLFSDHMILQRDSEVAVWGWADPGERLSITLGPSKRETVTSADGRWNVSLSAMPAGGPYTLVVQGKKTIVFKDVLFGEVWVASGQSNMTYALSGATGAAEEIPKANYDEIRFFTVPKKIAVMPQEDTGPAAWEICSPDTAKTFSAVAYFFARDLHRALGVPVGMVLSAWPGTAAEEWADPESLRREPVLQPIVQRLDASAETVKVFAARPADIALQFDDFELLSAPGVARGASIFSNFDDGSSRTATGGVWTYNWSDAKSTAFELVAPGRGGAGYAARIAGNIDGASSSNWQASFSGDAAPADMSAFAGVRFWVRGSGSFQFRMLQPTISDWDNYSTEVFQSAPEWKQITVWFKDLRQAGWGVAAPFTPNALTGFVISSTAPTGYPERPPSGLYEGMIVPLQRYKIRGAIWYQGEEIPGGHISIERCFPP